MTTIDGPSAPRVADGDSWIPSRSRFMEIVRDGVVVTALTFGLGAVTSAVLEDPINTYVIPPVLEAVGHYQQINLYKQTADGELTLDACYKLLVPPWSYEMSGRMREMVDPKECPAPSDGPALAPDKLPKPLQYKTSGAWNGGVMSGAFRHLNRAEFGGGSFSADDMRGTGIYVGAMTAQAHEPGEKCILTHYWVAVGEPDRANSFKDEVEKAIRGTDGKLALLPKTTSTSGGVCKLAQANPVQ